MRSVRFKVSAIFVSIVSVMIILLWLFQIVFLDDFYKVIKTNSVRSCASSIASNIDNKELNTLVYEIAQRNFVNVRVVKHTKNGFESVSISESTRSLEYCLADELLDKYYNDALNNDGTNLINIDNQDSFKFGNTDNINSEKTSEDLQNAFIGQTPSDSIPKAKGIVFCRVEKFNNEEYLILITSVISPVNSTIQTLSVQLLIITLIFLIFGTFIAFLTSQTISLPIENINDKAKMLAKGNFKVRFTEKGFREIEELSSTLNFAAEELGKADSLQNELIANVSHDLRTPLTMISGYAEMMRDIPGENTTENIQVIVDEANRLSRLVTDLLDISKMQASVSELEYEQFNITKELTEIVQSYASLSKQRGITVNLEYDQEVLADADKTKIKQVIYNLINNAVNYIGEDKTVLVKQTTKEKTVRIEIIDHGIGISKEDIANIWNRYYRVDKNHRTAIVGTGLGLSIVKSVLELHKTEYGVESELGKGSNFYFEIERVHNDHTESGEGTVEE